MSNEASKISRRSVLRKGTIASGALVAGGTAVVGSSAAHSPSSDAFVPDGDIQYFDVEGTEFFLKSETGPTTITCHRQPISVTEFQVDTNVDNDDFAERTLYIVNDQINQGDTVRVDTAAEKCRDSTNTRLEVRVVH